MTRGRIEPPDADAKEYWTYKPGVNNPPWFIRASHKLMWFRGRKDEEGEGEGSEAGMESEKELVEVVGRAGSRNTSRGETGVEGKGCGSVREIIRT